MGLMDKFKNLFTEEVEEEVPIKKEMIQVEIPSPKEHKKEKKIVAEEIETLDEFPVAKEEIKTEEPIKKREDEYKFPFFDDEDFEVIEERKEPKKEKQKPLYRSKEVAAYNPPKEEKHVFKPTPIISPVYGILDKNYVKEDIKARNTKPSSYYNPKEATIDEIRNKAYGALEEDISNNLYDEERALYEPIDIIDENYSDNKKNKVETSEYLFDEIERKKPIVSTDEPVARHAKSSDNSDELTTLLEQEMSRDVESTKEPAKISDQELFSLIDSMYERRDK